MEMEMSSHPPFVGPFEIVELDAAALGVQETNSCCPINTDCNCFLNELFGCGGCGGEK